MKLIDSRTKQIALLASAWLTRNRRPIFVGASAAGITGLLLAILTWLPPQMAPNLDSERERFEVVNAARRTLSQIVGGLAVLVVGGTTAWLALRRVNALEDQVHLSVQGQVTERFSRAIGQLDSTTDDGQLRLEVRMGGIRSLERVAQESADDREPILDILIP